MDKINFKKYIPENLINIFYEIHENGGYPFICGGFVRDILMNKQNKDIDIEVFGIKYEKMVEILKKYGNPKIVGSSFKIILMGIYEFSIIEEEFEKNTLQNYASRRDFTINSMYIDLLENNLIDFFNGRKDIENKIIKAVKLENLSEDPLRIIRLAQFKARFDFKIEEETDTYAKQNIQKINKIAPERIFIEIEKILLKSKQPSIAFRWLDKIGWLEMMFPELSKLNYIEQGKKYHPEGDAFTHTMLCIDALSLEERDITTMIAILFHDIGKGMIKITGDDDCKHFYMHEKAGADAIKSILYRITSNKELIDNVKKLIYYHMYPLHTINNISTKSIKKIASKVDFEKLMKVHKADMCGKGIDNPEISHIPKLIDLYNDIKSEMKPLIKGQDVINLGIKSGKEIGYILKKLYEAQQEELFFTYEEGLQYLKENLYRILDEFNL